MKHTTYFDTFLRDHVNINKTRLDLLGTRVEAVYAALLADPVVGPLVEAKIRQGSWPHKTIIKPRAGGEFDADFLLLLAVNDEWAGNPKAYANAVYNALHNHTTYGAMPHGRRTRCVFVKYAAEPGGVGCHLDIVPYVVLNDGRHVIVDQKKNDWESTTPEGFTSWIQGRDDITNKLFRKVVRLMKYYKVERGSFDAVPSVILTTLLGEQVSAIRAAIDPSYYGDLPTALVHIVTDMSSWMQQYQYTMPSIANPGGDGTTFDHRWSQQTFGNFRDRMAVCAANMQKALLEEDKTKSAKLWQDVFGPSFNPPGTATSSASSSSSMPSISTKLGAAAGAASGLVPRRGQAG